MDVFATFADDAHAVSFVRLTADHPQYPDRRMDFKEVNLFHLDENGQAYEFWGDPGRSRRGQLVLGAVGPRGTF